jgi:hypothetical protein
MKIYKKSITFSIATIIVFCFIVCCTIQNNQEKEINHLSKDKNTSYYVEKNGEILNALRGERNIWSINIIEECGKPEVGTPKIRNIELKEDKIIVTFGKHDFASVDAQSGEVKCLGSD